jgi:hypothetical protein
MVDGLGAAGGAVVLLHCPPNTASLHVARVRPIWNGYENRQLLMNNKKIRDNRKQ